MRVLCRLGRHSWLEGNRQTRLCGYCAKLQAFRVTDMGRNKAWLTTTKAELDSNDLNYEILRFARRASQ